MKAVTGGPGQVAFTRTQGSAIEGAPSVRLAIGAGSTVPAISGMWNTRPRS
jgi:hypothetical protein